MEVVLLYTPKTTLELGQFTFNPLCPESAFEAFVRLNEAAPRVRIRSSYALGSRATCGGLQSPQVHQLGANMFRVEPWDYAGLPHRLALLWRNVPETWGLRVA